MRGTMKAGVLLSMMLLPTLAGSAWAVGGTKPLATNPGGTTTAARPNTGINTDVPFPVGVDPICGLRITVYGSQPVNFYAGARMPAGWLPPQIVENPPHSGYWTITFGDPVNGPCYSRSDPRWWECGVFKGVHFGLYTNDPVVNYLNPDPRVWSQVGPPCVLFGPNGEVPCTGLTSHSAGHGEVAILNANPSAAAAFAAVRAKAGAQGLSIQNVRIAVAPDIVPINDLGPCAQAALQWQSLQLADSVLPPSDDQVGTLSVPIPDSILGQKGWAVMVYDVVDPATGNLLTTSTLDFPLNP